jgi:hypothetical protein
LSGFRQATNWNLSGGSFHIRIRYLSLERAFPLSNEADVEENQEKNAMENRARAADPGSFDQAGVEDRNRNPAEAEIEKNPRTHKERACKKLAYVLPWNLSVHFRLPSRISLLPEFNLGNRAAVGLLGVQFLQPVFHVAKGTQQA